MGMNNASNEKPSAFIAGLVEAERCAKADGVTDKIPWSYFCDSKPVNQQMTTDEVADLFAGDWMIKPGKTAGPGSMF